MIVDCIIYNNEKELLELRLNILNDFVDRFVIMEATQTFSGKSKPLYFEQDRELFKKWEHKIKYYVLDDYNNEEVWKMAGNSPNTSYGKGAQHWLLEFYIKEHLKEPLTDLKDDDIVFVSDCDEIWNPRVLTTFADPDDLSKRVPRQFGLPAHLNQLVYTYYLNNRSSEEWKGTMVSLYQFIKDECLNHIRSKKQMYIKNVYGWHFTSLKDSLRKKLTDSYTEESYATKEVLDNLDKNIENNKDFLGRDFTFKIDEENWPDYLKKNRDKYKHLLKDG